MRGRGGLHHLGLNNVELALRVEGLLPRRRFVKHRTQGVDIGPSVDVALSLHLLGRHVVDRADYGPDLRQGRVMFVFGQSQPGQLDHAVRTDIDRRRRDFPVNDFLLVGVVQGRQGLTGDIDGLGNR